MPSRPVLVSGSAIGGYGDRGDEQLTEASRPAPASSPRWSSRGRPPAPAEAEPASASPRIRTGIVLDPDGGALLGSGPPVPLGILGKLGNGQQWMSWISLADEVAAMRFLLDPRASGPVNLTAPHRSPTRCSPRRLGRAAPPDVPAGARLRPQAAGRR